VNIAKITIEMMEDRKNQFEAQGDWAQIGRCLSNGKWKPEPLEIVDYWRDFDTGDLVVILAAH